eukprot:811400-Pyramimonas_sp.AAC.1
MSSQTRGFHSPRYRYDIYQTDHPVVDRAGRQVMTIQFAWGGETKSVGTSFLGVSPEFEIALYTLCFLSGSEETEVELGDYHVKIRAYRIGRNMIGTAFPESSEDD